MAGSHEVIFLRASRYITTAIVIMIVFVVFNTDRIKIDTNVRRGHADEVETYDDTSNNMELDIAGWDMNEQDDYVTIQSDEGKEKGQWNYDDENDFVTVETHQEDRRTQKNFGKQIGYVTVKTHQERVNQDFDDRKEYVTVLTKEWAGKNANFEAHDSHRDQQSDTTGFRQTTKTYIKELMNDMPDSQHRRGIDEEQNTTFKHTLTKTSPPISGQLLQENTPTGTLPPIHNDVSLGEKCKQRFPDVIIVGIAKSGTSALRIFLNEHPQIAAGTLRDEPRFFTGYWGKGFEWYRSVMPCSYSNQITIEKSPGYFYSEEAAKRIRNFSDKIKIIMIMRDPVERAVSAYAMYKAQGRFNGKSFADLMYMSKSGVSTEHEMIEKSLYVEHLSPWLRLWNRNDILILDGNNFKRNPYEEVHKVERFLGLKPYFTPDSFVFNEEKNKYCAKRVNGVKCLAFSKGRKHPEIPIEDITTLQRYFAPKNEALFNVIGERFNWTY
ncbi:HS3S6-like protein [Mya arenaria]|uniref:HS3S6-like protein n=1 Tax=Mya arenaria TaxID=6604 RepID=A0ABY7G7D1_MYAAR|nr:HS3S6-like protein [Mya arenaria]